MHIGIIGTGAMGGALGKLWAAQGHTVTFSYSRNPQKLEQLAAEAGHGAKAGAPQEAAAADVVLISVLWSRIDDALAAAGSLKGKNVIDCMLPMTADDSGLAIGHTTSGGEELARRSGARVVKGLIEQAGFEAVDAGVLERARYLEPLGLLIGKLALEEGLGEQIGLKLLRR